MSSWKEAASPRSRLWKTGHSLIKSKMKETLAPLAGEMSGHIFFKHQWYGFDDALYAAIRTIRAVSASGKSLTELKSEMPVSVATPELRFQVDESRKFAVIGEVAERLAAEGANVNATDGVRVSTPDGGIGVGALDRIAEMGGKPLMWKTGHSLIKSKMKETHAPLAGEMSGHIFFKHQWYGFDDALYAAIRTIRAVSASGKSLTELKSEMPVSVATPELRFQVDESRKFAVIGEVAERLAAEGANVNATDGVRVSTPDGWWLLRASNTQDVLVARAEAKDKTGLDRLMATVNEQLERSGIAAVEAAH